jgi:DNA-binding NtrC family response regulator
MPQHQCVASAEISPTIPLGGSPTIGAAHLALPQPWKGRRLLWVDDSRLLLSLYKSVFENLRFEVLATSSPDEALEHVSSNAPDVAILDYDMPEIDINGYMRVPRRPTPMIRVTRKMTRKT